MDSDSKITPVVALYVRISDPRKGQVTENQLLQLRAFCESKNWKIVEVYQDLESGGGTKLRLSYERILEDAAKPNRRWNLLVFWSLDRFSREGVYPTIHRLRELHNLGVRFISYQEQYLDTLGPFREAVMAILAAVAALERNRISERVKAGIARCRLEGKVFGRKPAQMDEDKLLRMQAKGASLAQMALAVGTSRTTVLRRLRRLFPAGPGPV
jgi:DNA invertase Pin-like site-specific DNA recombinase